VVERVYSPFVLEQYTTTKQYYYKKARVTPKKLLKINL